MTDKHVNPSSGATPFNASLIHNACAQVAELQESFRAFIALEHLISPNHEDEEHAIVPPSRAELGALLHVMNTEMLRRMEVLAAATARAQRACDPSPYR